MNQITIVLPPEMDAFMEKTRGRSKKLLSLLEDLSGLKMTSDEPDSHITMWARQAFVVGMIDTFLKMVSEHDLAEKLTEINTDYAYVEHQKTCGERIENCVCWQRPH